LAGRPDRVVTFAQMNCFDFVRTIRSSTSGPELYTKCERALAKQHVTLKPRDPSKSLAEQIAGTHVIVPTTEPVPGEAIEACAPTLKIIAQPAAGFDAIDVKTAKRLGVPVCTHGGVNADSVAELTWLIILNVARRIHDCFKTFQAVQVGTPLGRQLRGKTLCIVGMGKIGEKVSCIAKAFGMTVTSTRSKTPREEFLRLIAEADVVSLHCPLTPATKDLIGAEELSAMKDGVMLINMARGPVVNYDAVVSAIKSGKVAGFGMDVHWVEPSDPNLELYSLPNVVAIPHMGAATEEVFDTMADLIAEDVRQLRAGEKLTCQLEIS